MQITAKFNCPAQGAAHFAQGAAHFLMHVFFFVEIVRSFGSVPSKSRRRTSLLFRTNADLEVSRFRALFVTQCFFFTRNRAFLRSFAFEFIGEEQVYFSERMRPYLFANFGFCC